MTHHTGIAIAKQPN